MSGRVSGELLTARIKGGFATAGIPVFVAGDLAGADFRPLWILSGTRLADTWTDIRLPLDFGFHTARSASMLAPGRWYCRHETQPWI